MTGLPEPVVIVGAGRLGLAMAEALVGAGVVVSGVVARSAEARARCAARGIRALSSPDGAATVVLCVPDDAIAAVAATLTGSVRVVMHTSGCVGLDALAPAAERGAMRASVHPMHTVTGADRGSALAGVPMAVTADGASAHVAALALVRALGGRPFTIEDAAKPLYHAAAALAANGTVAVLDAAIACAVAAGMPESEACAALAGLALSAAVRVRELGPSLALTGPVARGDAGTVRAHRKALAASLPDHLPLYDAAARGALTVARRGGLPAGAASAVGVALDTEPSR